MMEQEPNRRLGLYYENDYEKVPYHPQYNNQNNVGFSVLIKTYFRTFSEIEFKFHCIGKETHHKMGIIFLFPKQRRLFFPIELTYKIDEKNYTSYLVNHFTLNKRLMIESELFEKSLFLIKEDTVYSYQNEINEYYRFDLIRLPQRKEITVCFRVCCKSNFISKMLELFENEKFTIVVENNLPSQTNVLFCKSEKPEFISKILENENPEPQEISFYIEYALYVQHNFWYDIQQIALHNINSNSIKRKVYFLKKVNTFHNQITTFINEIKQRLFNENVEEHNITILNLESSTLTNILQSLEHSDRNTLNNIIIISDSNISFAENDISILTQMKETYNLISCFVLYDSFSNRNNNAIQYFCKATDTYFLKILQENDNIPLKEICYIINCISPSNYVLNFSMSFNNNSEENNNIYCNIISNIFTHKRKYKARHISKPFNFLALVPRSCLDILDITLTYSFRSTTIQKSITFDINNPIKNNLLHKMIIKKVSCTSYNQINSPKSNYLHLLYQTIRHDGSLVFITALSNNNDSIQQYINNVSLFKSRFPVWLIKIEDQINNKFEYKLLPFTCIYKNITEILNIDIEQHRVEVFDLYNNRKRIQNDNLSSMDFNDNISGMIIKIS